MRVQSVKFEEPATRFVCTCDNHVHHTNHEAQLECATNVIVLQGSKKREVPFKCLTGALELRTLAQW
uniref:Uncharacterized protein n=1 Tax=Anguilla anguilla TaxID=7936 RepID=A0A0E9RMN3_ANGAN